MSCAFSTIRLAQTEASISYRPAFFSPELFVSALEVTLDFVKGIQKAKLPISVTLDGGDT